MKFDTLKPEDYRESERLYPGDVVMQYIYCVQLQTLRVMASALFGVKVPDEASK